MRHSLAVALAATATLSAAPVLAEPLAKDCAQSCTITLTALQLLAQAERLVAAREFETAKPLVAALANVPEYTMQRHFLAGYIAVETGQLDEAIEEFRAALINQPQATRIRLELARALMLRGKDGGADYNYRLAQQDDSLPPEILATVKAARNLLRDRRPWHLSADVGIAPDSNVTGGTEAETIDVTFGNQVLPFTLQGNARKRSGLGQTASVSGGWRFKFGEQVALLADADMQGTNYEGTSVDDYTGQLAIGPQYRFNDETSVSLQGIASQRWYGGQRASTQFGARGQLQHLLSRGQRAGFTIDTRHTNSGFSPDYDGWTIGAYASYERVMMRSFIASASVFARTDQLRSAIYSNKEFGFNLGIGGELPHGINAGISGGLSRATYNAPLLALGPDARKDWRYSGRVYAGLRSVRLFGLSPSVTWSFSKTDASVMLYKTDRQRFAFNLAKYF
jgi:outer membrane protein